MWVKKNSLKQKKDETLEKATEESFLRQSVLQKVTQKSYLRKKRYYVEI